MLSKVTSFGLTGIDGFSVQIETDMVGGVPNFDMVGLGDTAVKESKERVKSAIRNSGLEFPVKHYTINLAPADIKKEGPMYDLGIAVGILSASEQIKNKKYKNFVYIGELSLDGTVQKVKGVLPILISARNMGYKNVVIPKANEENFKFYRAQVINSQNISAEYFDANEVAYKKEYKKKCRKLKFYEWCKILFCFAIAGAFLVGMILYK